VSDVYQRRLARAKGLCQGDAYPDYRRLLERKDIDAVLIATPDHWHAKISMEAMETGKHVYVEKPMTHTVEQALKLRDAVQHAAGFLQVGPNGTANDSYWVAHQAIQAGRIGKVTWAQASYNRNARICLFNEHQKIDPTAGRTRVETITSTGTCGSVGVGSGPRIPWNPNTSSASASTGLTTRVATDLLYHKLAPLLIAISGPDASIRCGQRQRRALHRKGWPRHSRYLPHDADYPSQWSLFLVST